MVNGLILKIEEFRALPQKRKLDCLYENQVMTLRMLSKYKFHQKIQYPWLGVLTMAIIFIIKNAIGS